MTLTFVHLFWLECWILLIGFKFLAFPNYNVWSVLFIPVHLLILCAIVNVIIEVKKLWKSLSGSSKEIVIGATVAIIIFYACMLWIVFFSGLKLDGVIPHMPWGVIIGMPMYILLGIIAIIPCLVVKYYKSEKEYLIRHLVTSIAVYLAEIVIFIFILLLHLELDGVTNNSYLWVFFPIYFTLSSIDVFLILVVIMIGIYVVYCS